MRVSATVCACYPAGVQSLVLRATGALLVCLLPYLASAQIVETYFIPLDDNELQQSLDQLYTSTSSTMQADISIVVPNPNTIIYYDHWETGSQPGTYKYESEITSSLIVWGDGDLGNGSAPCVTPALCTGDVLSAGAVITLSNSFPVPRVPSTVVFDGHDRIWSTRSIGVSRLGYASTPGSLLAGAVAVPRTEQWAYSYEVPIGENVVGDNDMFQLVALNLMAGYPNTRVFVDANGDGDYTDTGSGASDNIANDDINGAILTVGETLRIDDIQIGATVSTSRPVMAHLVTGDVADNYEARFFELYPTSKWGSSYCSPVGATVAADETHIYVYNPNNTAINITREGTVGSGPASVNPGQVGKYVVTTNAATCLSSTKAFFALSTIDSEPSGFGGASNSIHDWGYTLVPLSNLTDQVLVGLGEGDNGTTTENYNPVWITVVDAGTHDVYVDNDGNPATGALTDAFGRGYDQLFSLTRLQSQRVLDASDGDQSGMFIYTLDGSRIASAWGQDPSTAVDAAPALDVGSTIFPFDNISLLGAKTFEILDDAGNIGLADPGETIRFAISIDNLGVDPQSLVTVVDNLPPNGTYVPNSTTVNGGPVPDETVPPATTAYPLDEGGYSLGTVSGGGSVSVGFDFIVDETYLSPDDIFNQALIYSVTETRTVEVEVPVSAPDLAIIKSADPVADVGAGDEIQYTVTVVNASPITQTNVTVAEVGGLPTGTTYVPGSSQVTYPNPGSAFFLDSFATPDYGGDDGTVSYLAPWTEVNDDGSPTLTTGGIYVTQDAGGNSLFLTGNTGSQYIYRTANTLGYAQVFLEFDSKLVVGSAPSTCGAVEVASSPSGPWTSLGTFCQPDVSYTHFGPVDITAVQSATTAVRFRNLASGVEVFYDNIRINGSNGTSVAAGSDPTSPPHELATGYALEPGETLIVTFSVTVDSPISPGLDEICNIAQVTSTDQTTPYTDDACSSLLNTTGQIGVAKFVSLGPTQLGGGDWLVEFTLRIKNTGNTVLSNVQVVEDLQDLFVTSASQPVTSWHLWTVGDAVVVSDNLTRNTAYNGGKTAPQDLNLLTGTDELIPGEEGTIHIRVVVDVFGTSLFLNQVEAFGTYDAQTVSDLSDDFVNVDENENGDPTDDSDPTPILIKEVTLSIELARFDGVVSDRDIDLIWETSSETNSAGFSVQHAFEDGEWENLTFIQAAGTSTSAKSYAFTLPSVPYGFHRFRLETLDLDGLQAYGPEIEVVMELPGEFALDPVYPNPFNPMANVSFAVKESKPVRVELYSALGQFIELLYAGEPEAGRSQTVRFNATGLSSGVYIVRLVGERIHASTTAVVLK